MNDPCIYPGTEILRNKEGIQNAEDLESFERTAAASRMEMLPETIKVTREGYYEIHKYIFQDVYDWAGKARTVDIAKSNSYFCRAGYITKELDKTFRAINAEDNLRGLSADQFAARAAEHLSELNAIHPFREGNGRVQRAFLVLLAHQAGHEVDLQKIEPEAWNQASRESFLTGDCSRLRGIVGNALNTEREVGDYPRCDGRDSATSDLEASLEQARENDGSREP